MFGLSWRGGGVHMLTRMLLAAVSRWLVATAGISNCGANKLSNCPRASQQSIKTLFIARWHDRTLRGKGFYTGYTVCVLNGSVMEHNQLIKGSAHSNFNKDTFSFPLVESSLADSFSLVLRYLSLRFKHPPQYSIEFQSIESSHFKILMTTQVIPVSLALLGSVFGVFGCIL